MSDNYEMTKAELSVYADELECLVEWLFTTKQEVGATKKDGRKEEVLAVLEHAGEPGLSIQELADQIGISTRNISSQLTYLRKAGHEIWTNGSGRKFLKK